MLMWVDEFAWLVATLDFPGFKLVTRAMESADFHTQVPSGSILRFSIVHSLQGSSSVTYAVEVFADEPGATTEKLVFTNQVTFVCVDDEGNKRSLPTKKVLRSREAHHE